ncbi:DUF1471 domain-containing protein [Citrobacter sp. FDAARGOS_156]|nr:DUF1471 domain-containing protein [Citrobacter sp. FDAARGOS_156]EIS7448827.1 DUF1471 domain-containing protein [Citrobacter youngae]TKU06479.1 DUF1471 domain-containing protein [Citrobacter sp. wls828]TKU21837.1 DUF1471 domain-containing protein [Citrobacter sp. wls827]TKU38759.1 DUF1471 domain-containing protein [Citrobacter sp. wls716]
MKRSVFSRSIINIESASLPHLCGGFLAHVSVSAISAAPSDVEEDIAKLAQEKLASSWKITSMRIDSSTYVTAILYK